MRRLTILRYALGGLAGLVLMTLPLTAVTPNAADLPPDEAAFFAAGMRLQQEAWRQFTALAEEPDADVDPRTIAYGKGLLLLNRQPVTQGALRDADGLFAQVAASGDDEVALAARYYQARLRELHFEPKDPEAAQEIYAELITEAPASFWGQLSFMKSAQLLLWAEGEPADAAETLDTLWARGDALLTHPVMRRLFFRFLGEAYLLYEVSERKGRDAFLESAAHGFMSSNNAADMLLRIAGLSVRLDEPAVALAHYRQYLAECPLDTRHQLAEEAIAALEEGKEVRYEP